MATLYASGFEHGSKTAIPSTDADDYANVAVDTNSPHTGTYGCRVFQGTGSNWVRFPVSTDPSEAWFSVWFQTGGTGKHIRIEFEMSDGTTAGIRKDAGGNNYDLYSGSTKLEDGATTVGSSARLLELHLSDTELTLTMDGLAELSYSGNAKPGASEISYVRFYLSNTSSGDFFRLDDLTISDSEAPGDIRYIRLAPDGDSAVTWTPSTGSDNYALIDEHPPSDTDYVETSTTNDEDLYTLANYTTGKTVDHLTQWIRAAYQTISGSIIPVVKSGTTTDVATSQSLTSSALYYWQILPTDPDTDLPWGTTSINALLIGQRATVGLTGSVRVYQHIIEVGYTQQDEPGISHVLSMDVDDENGTRAYVSKLDAGTLTLAKHSTSTLLEQNTFTFGSCTEVQLAARTFWLGAYTPPFFGTSNFGDYVFAFGRWDDSGVAHLKLSTDGGATFGSDLADGSWGSDWVGAFFATSTTTYYTFINGTSPGLWRSTNSGTSWTKLSVTPVDVDFNGVSLHPDGRLLITSRDSGAAQAYYADASGDYASWTNISGTLPTGDGELAAAWVV